MPRFFDLPRELRDMIYMAIITWERPRPRQDVDYEWEDSNGGCLFSEEPVPSTCANVLAANRRVNIEMMQAIERARRANVLCAKIDCIVNYSIEHFFTWLSLPLVHTTQTITSPDHTATCSWALIVPVVGRLLASPQRKEATNCTTIEQLQLDIRLCTHIGTAILPSESYRTRWAICEALKSVVGHGGPYLSPKKGEVTIDTLVLNVLPYPLSVLRQSQLPCQESGQQDPSIDLAKYAHVLAQDLVNLWNALWSNGEWRAEGYRHLLQRIQKVRVCVDGELIRVRELKPELERGQRELRRIAARVGW